MRDDGGSAFPINGAPGMSLRDYFAGQALAGFSVSSAESIDIGKWGWPEVARVAYMAADAMIAARKEGA